jgi:hypothetical protein
MSSGGLLTSFHRPDGRQPLPWDYFRVARENEAAWRRTLRVRRADR